MRFSAILKICFINITLVVVLLLVSCDFTIPYKSKEAENKGDFNSAEKILVEAIKKSPKNNKLLDNLNKLRQRWAEKILKEAISEKNIKKFKLATEKASAIESDIKQDLIIKINFSLVDFYKSSNDNRNVLISLIQTMSFTNNNTRVRKKLLEFLHSVEDKEWSKQAFGQILQLYRDDVEVVLSYALFLEYQKKYSDAINYYERAMYMRPGHYQSFSLIRMHVERLQKIIKENNKKSIKKDTLKN